MKFVSLLLAPLASAAVIWDGRFNNFNSSTDLNKWSWANQVGPYQYYIHGSGSVTEVCNGAFNGEVANIQSRLGSVYFRRQGEGGRRARDGLT
jgi:hypothetical protein